jgi:hypothetical protein
MKPDRAWLRRIVYGFSLLGLAILFMLVAAFLELQGRTVYGTRDGERVTFERIEVDVIEPASLFVFFEAVSSAAGAFLLIWGLLTHTSAERRSKRPASVDVNQEMD